MFKLVAYSHVEIYSQTQINDEVYNFFWWPISSYFLSSRSCFFKDRQFIYFGADGGLEVRGIQDRGTQGTLLFLSYLWLEKYELDALDAKLI